MLNQQQYIQMIYSLKHICWLSTRICFRLLKYILEQNKQMSFVCGAYVIIEIDNYCERIEY